MNALTVTKRLAACNFPEINCFNKSSLKFPHKRHMNKLLKSPLATKSLDVFSKVLLLTYQIFLVSAKMTQSCRPTHLPNTLESVVKIYSKWTVGGGLSTSMLNLTHQIKTFSFIYLYFHLSKTLNWKQLHKCNAVDLMVTFSRFEHGWIHKSGNFTFFSSVQPFSTSDVD